MLAIQLSMTVSKCFAAWLGLPGLNMPTATEATTTVLTLIAGIFDGALEGSSSLRCSGIIT